jgi:hypothetical protein
MTLTSGRIARLMGRLFFVGGFLLAVYGLSEHNRFLVNASLGLIATGIVATGFALYRHVKDARSEQTPRD